MKKHNPTNKEIPIKSTVLTKNKALKHKKDKQQVNSNKKMVTQIIADDLVQVGHLNKEVKGIEVKSEELKGIEVKSEELKGIEVKSEEFRANSLKHAMKEPGKDLNKIDESDLAKIAKKKAKKQAQKLKKKQKKALTPNNEENGKEEKPTINKIKESDIEVKDQIKLEQNSALITKKSRTQQTLEEKTSLTGHEESPKKVPGDETATIFVGNLPINTKRVQLVRLFRDVGPVNAVRFRTASGKTIFKHKHRLEAGSLNAYIVFKDVETANRALTLNGVEFKSNHLRITRADKNAHNSNDINAKRTIFVGNLKYSATDEKLREIFSSCGEIEYIRCLRDGEKGCNGVAYICFKAPEAVGLALELKGTMLDERPVHIERYTVKKLGAKEQRDAKSPKPPLTGAKKRMQIKNKNKDNSKLSEKSNDDVNKKKGEFRGVKVKTIKKKQKKKKPSNQMLQLAKKIAPKTT